MHHPHRAVGLDADGGGVEAALGGADGGDDPGRAEVGGLGVAGDAGADEPPLGPGLGRRCWRALPVEPFQDHVEQSGVVAAVEKQAGGHEVRDGVDQVAAPQLGGVETEPAGGDVDGPFQREVALGLADTPEGAERRLVGHDRPHLDVDVGDLVGAGHGGARRPRRAQAAEPTAPPRSATPRARRPEIVPSAMKPISTVNSMSRAWALATTASARSSVQRTGRPARRAR